MMGPEPVFTRDEILERLRRTIRAGKPILAAGCSVGLVAKCAEIGGADLLVVYSTGRSRIMGLPTTPLGHSNPVTLAMYDEIANVVNGTPIVGGAEAIDPTFLRLGKLIDRFRQTGYHGLINFPTIGNNPARSSLREDVGLGFSREVEMVRLAREQEYFTMAYVHDSEQARQMAAAGVDVQVPHVGWTAGGLSGARDTTYSLEKGAESVQAMIETTRSENPTCICLAHGGPFASPEDTEYLYAHTDALGFVGASSVERIPIERAVRDAVAAFKSVPLRHRRDG
jgi:predicted TIM-barrel enzyme